MTKQIPVVDYLVLDDGSPHLVANEAVATGALFLGRQNADGHGGGEEFKQRRLADTGTVRSFTIVHRSNPGVTVPFVSVVVDLDGGGMVRANLSEVSPEPDSIPVDMRVRMTTFVVGTDPEGTEAVSFGFEPLKEQEDTHG
ncbi:MAG: OB-fold domain-containing protein [bacterium]